MEVQPVPGSFLKLTCEKNIIPHHKICTRSSKVSRNRVGGLTLEDFPSINSGADNCLVTMEDIEASSSSSEEEEDEDEDVSVNQSVGGSVKKYLPKPLLGRKSVFISGNLKRGGKRQSPKKKILGKSRKNLNPMMDRISREGMKKEEDKKEEVDKKVEKEEKVEKVEKVEPRRSSGRAATKAAGQSLSPAVLQVGWIFVVDFSFHQSIFFTASVHTFTGQVGWISVIGELVILICCWLFLSHLKMQVALATPADQAFMASTASSTPADSGDKRNY